jgi:hypothetical protein
MSIHGPVALLRLVGTAREPWRPEHGVRVSRYHEGFPEAMLPELQRAGLLEAGVSPESICGTDDKQPAVCYASSDPTAFDRTRTGRAHPDRRRQPVHGMARGAGQPHVHQQPLHLVAERRGLDRGLVQLSAVQLRRRFGHRHQGHRRSDADDGRHARLHAVHACRTSPRSRASAISVSMCVSRA